MNFAMLALVSLYYLTGSTQNSSRKAAEETRKYQSLHRVRHSHCAPAQEQGYYRYQQRLATAQVIGQWSRD